MDWVVLVNDVGDFHAHRLGLLAARVTIYRLRLQAVDIFQGLRSDWLLTPVVAVLDTASERIVGMTDFVFGLLDDGLIVLEILLEIFSE